MEIVDNFDNFFYEKNRYKKCKWSSEYKGHLIRSDINVNSEVLICLFKLEILNFSSTKKTLLK